MDLIKSILGGAIIAFLFFTFIFEPFGHDAYLPVIIIALIFMAFIIIYVWIKTSE